MLISRACHGIAGDAVADALRELLLPIWTIVPPNRCEAKALSGIGVEDEASACAAARAIAGRGARAGAGCCGSGCDADPSFHEGPVAPVGPPTCATAHRTVPGGKCTAPCAPAAAKGEGGRRGRG